MRMEIESSSSDAGLAPSFPLIVRRLGQRHYAALYSAETLVPRHPNGHDTKGAAMVKDARHVTRPVDRDHSMAVILDILTTDC